jgi:DinB superfamily
MKRIILAVLVLGLTPLVAMAQQAAAPQASVEANPVSNAVRKILDRESKIMVSAVDEMPADKFSFRPTPAQITFGHLVMHMTGSNNALCSAISGTSSPPMEKLDEADPKDKLVAALKNSFDYCTQALSKVDDSNLGEQVKFFGGRTISRAGAMIALTNDFYDHYSAAAMYLRLNGLLPPTAQPHKD